MRKQLISIIKQGSAKQNVDPEIINKLAVGMKKLWTNHLKILVHLRCAEINWLSLKTVNMKKCLSSMMIFTKTKIHITIPKKLTKEYADLQQFIFQSCTSVISKAYICLEAEITSKFSDSRALIEKPADEMQFTPT